MIALDLFYSSLFSILVGVIIKAGLNSFTTTYSGLCYCCLVVFVSIYTTKMTFLGLRISRREKRRGKASRHLYMYIITSIIAAAYPPYLFMFYCLGQHFN